MDFRRSETPYRPSVDAIIQEPNLTIDAELDACNEILNKPHLLRAPQEIERVVSKLTSLEIFGRSILENLDPKTVIKKLMPFIKQEFFAAGKPIFHFEQPADKMYILLRGKAKEFVPKGIDEIEEESHYRYGGFQYLQGVPISMPELTKCETPPSVSSLPAQQKGQYSSLNTISEENEEDGGTSEMTKKRLRKLKAVLPFLKKLNTNKNSTQCVEEYRYKRTIKKIRSILKPSVIDEEINVEALERELGCHVVDEFKKYPKQYFIGGILKVHFSKYLYPGSHCGLRALRDNSLRSRAVFAEEDCHCISLSREDFMTVLENEKALNIDKIEFFKKMFNMVDEKTAIEFALLWESHPCKTNDTIFQQNDPSNYLYVLCSGEVMLSKTIAQNNKLKAPMTTDLPYRIKRKTNPNEHTLRVATICSGDFFGEEDFFEEKPREFTAVVSSTKAKVYRLPHEKYKNLCKNYSEILKEVRKWMSLKIDWKKERLEELYQHHSNLQEKGEVKDGRREQEKNLIALGLLSPELQPSSLRLKMKLLEKTKVQNPNLNNELKVSKGSIDNTKSYNEKALDAIKENYRKDISDDEELFSRTKLPRQYDQKHEGFLRQNSEIFKLEFREDELTRRQNYKKTGSQKDLEPKRPFSNSKDRGILSSPSLRMVKKRFLKEKKVGAATLYNLDSKDCKDPFMGIPSLDLDLKIQSQDVLQNNSLTLFGMPSSVNEKNFRQTVIGPFITQNNNVTSLDKLDKVEKPEKPEKAEKGSLATTDVTSRQTLQSMSMSRTLIDSRSLNKTRDDRTSRGMTSPIHAQLKSRTSLKNLRLTIGKRESIKPAEDISYSSKENLENHKAFRILGEKAKALGIQLKRWTPSIKNGKCVSVTNIHNESQS